MLCWNALEHCGTSATAERGHAEATKLLCVGLCTNRQQARSLVHGSRNASHSPGSTDTHKEFSSTSLYSFVPPFITLYSSRSIRVNGQANLGNLSDVCFHDTGPEILCMPKWLPKAAWAGAVAPLSRIWSTIAGEEWPKWGSPVRINSKQPTTLVLHHETSRKAMGASNAKFHMLSQNLVQTTGQPNSPDKSDSVLALPIKL